MKLEISEFDVSGIGETTSEASTMWASLGMKFKDRETGKFPNVGLKVFVSRDRNATFGEIEEAIRQRAIEVLREALAHLEEHDGPSLESMATEGGRRHLSELAASISDRP